MSCKFLIGKAVSMGSVLQVEDEVASVCLSDDGIAKNLQVCDFRYQHFAAGIVFPADASVFGRIRAGKFIMILQCCAPAVANTYIRPEDDRYDNHTYEAACGIGAEGCSRREETEEHLSFPLSFA